MTKYQESGSVLKTASGGCAAILIALGCLILAALNLTHTTDYPVWIDNRSIQTVSAELWDGGSVPSRTKTLSPGSTVLLGSTRDPDRAKILFRDTVSGQKIMQKSVQDGVHKHLRYTILYGEHT